MMLFNPSFSSSHELLYLSSVSFLSSVAVSVGQLDDHFGRPLSASTQSHLLANNRASMISVVPLIEATMKIGENAFAAAFLIAFIQAGVAIYQYRTNPQGELMIPPGLTWGVETPTSAIDISIFQEDSVVESMIGPEGVDDTELKGLSISKSDIRSMYKRPLSVLNKWMVLLLPWIWQHVNYALTRGGHFFHIGFIYSLVSVLSIRTKKYKESHYRQFLDGNSVPDEQFHADKAAMNAEQTQKVVTIGDSLAVGLGCIDVFDTNKNQTMPIMRLERLSRDENHEKLGLSDGPAFPRVLAQTLAKNLKRRIFWRSAGVDGGTVQDIRKHCIGVVKEEADKGHAPDIVVVLCGMNDLKRFVGNPLKANSAGDFQNDLLALIADIRQNAPGCKIILPSMPTQTFRRNSMMNIFPLALFLDTVVSLWDSQKKIVAEMLSPDVIYTQLSAADIFDWYSNKNDVRDGELPMLISADGVHPNRRCYAYWAKAVGNQICQDMFTEENDEAQEGDHTGKSSARFRDS